MSNELIQWVLDIVFSKYMVYLSPMVFLFMMALFADRIIDLLYNALSNRRR